MYVGAPRVKNENGARAIVEFGPSGPGEEVRSPRAHTAGVGSAPRRIPSVELESRIVKLGMGMGNELPVKR